MERKWGDISQICKLDIECLGKGIDASRPQLLLHAQIVPTSQNVERRKIGTGVQDWKSGKLPTVAAVKDKLLWSLSEEPAQIISFEVGFEMQRDESDKRNTEASGKRIHNQTVLFDTTKIRGSSIHLVSLLKKATKEKGPLSIEERDAISRSLVRDFNEGITHYISSVDLGAKAYYIKEQGQEQKQEQVHEFTYDFRGMARSCPSKVYLVIDPSVKLEAENTVVREEQEKTISFAVKPLWSLIDDPIWRLSVKKACEDYLNDQLPSAEEQYLIKAVNDSSKFKYLKMTTDDDKDKMKIVIGLDDAQHATGFTFMFPNMNSTENPHGNNTDLFYICPKLDDQHFYLTATSTANPVVICSQWNVHKEQSIPVFVLVHPATEKKGKVSKWKKEGSFHLVQHYTKVTFGFKRTIEKYLQLCPDTKRSCLSLVLKEKDKLYASAAAPAADTYCLFSLERKNQEQFMIKAVKGSREIDSDKYLKISKEHDHIEGTGKQEDATVFSFIFSDSTENGFYLRSKLGSQHFYLTSTIQDPSANSNVIHLRLTVSPEDRAKFYLGHPATKELEKMCKWKEQESLHLVRHEGATSKYLLLHQGQGDKLVLKEKGNLEDSDGYCLFSIEKV
jgi:hypothetical protein